MSSNICLSLIDMRRYTVIHTALLLLLNPVTSHTLLLSSIRILCYSDARQSRTTELNALSNCVSKVSTVQCSAVQYVDLYHLGFYLCARPCINLLVCLHVSVCLFVCVLEYESGASYHTALQHDKTSLFSSVALLMIKGCTVWRQKRQGLPCQRSRRPDHWIFREVRTSIRTSTTLTHAPS